MSDYTVGPALKCDLGCGALSPVTKAQQDAGDCPLCLESATAVEITVAPCPNGGRCNDQEHDFGRGIHVRPL